MVHPKSACIIGNGESISRLDVRAHFLHAHAVSLDLMLRRTQTRYMQCISSGQLAAMGFPESNSPFLTLLHLNGVLDHDVTLPHTFRTFLNKFANMNQVTNRSCKRLVRCTLRPQHTITQPSFRQVKDLFTRQCIPPQTCLFLPYCCSTSESI